MRGKTSVIGRLDSATGAHMQTQTYTLHYVMAEREWDEVLEAPTQARAIQMARDEALGRFEAQRPVGGYCAVMLGPEVEAEALGAWDWDAETGALTWEAAE